MVACSRMDSEKCSRRLLRRTESFGCGLLFLLTTCLTAAQPGAAEPVADAPTNALETFLDHLHTLKADFHQEVWSDKERIESASGELALERPNRFRWHYREPIEQLIVADGKRLWMYDVELEQVTVTPLDDPATSSPALLLAGDQSVRDSFTIVESFTRDGIEWVRLEPKLPETDFRSVLIGFRDGLPVRLEMVDGLDQLTRIDLDKVELNPTLDAALFDFTPPRGVDVIGDP